MGSKKKIKFSDTACNFPPAISGAESGCPFKIATHESSTTRCCNELASSVVMSVSNFVLQIVFHLAKIVVESC